MGAFITRVELHYDKNASDYALLHNEMLRAGFKRTIVSDEPKTYYLPTAEYQCDSPYTCPQVAQIAYDIAKKIDLNCSVFTVEYTKASWHNLKVVNS